MTDELTELLHRARIQDTIHTYSKAIDRRDLDLLDEVFTDDAVFDYGNGARHSGRDALRALVDAATGRYVATNHHCSTTIFERLDGDEAETLTYVYAFHETPAGEHMHLWGCYEDVLKRTERGWRIAERRVRVAGCKTTPADELPERFERYARTPVG
ncbi:nuclear transport factor 2 family protein [Actinomadura rugatobispora]|uniref:Nuclear transport factor 2 family protein n=1 Tax=Actinomadura rugatobispora TaxID=1994 RepID=A0ABW1A7K3_9ACTN|nr:hypothetical protein GCM10010200_000400 [Actinomadura rugatobispora]